MRDKKVKGLNSNGFAAIKDDFVTNCDLPPIGFRLACFIAAFDECELSHSEISSRIGLSVDTVSKYLRILTERGFIKKIRDHDPKTSTPASYRPTSKLI